MKHTELLDAVASTAGMTVDDSAWDTRASLNEVVASIEKRDAVATSILGTINTETRAARIGRNRRSTDRRHDRRHVDSTPDDRP